MLDIKIKTIPHSQQRYETVGDYQSYNGAIDIRVSDLGNWRYEILVAVHELIEKAWALYNGVTDEQIDAFDMAYEAKRVEGDESEPGDDPACPVYHGHQFATVVEKQLAEVLGVTWETYEDAINALSKNDGTRVCHECHRSIFENEVFFSAPALPNESQRREYHMGCTVRR